MNSSSTVPLEERIVDGLLSREQAGRHDDRQTTSSQHRKPDQYVIYLHQKLPSDITEISGDCCFTTANDPSERDTRATDD